MTQTHVGVKLCFDAINAQRGIGGEKVQLTTLNDHFDPKLAAVNARELTGAMVLRSPVRKYVFNVRASYQHEAERAITHRTSMGGKRIAILHVNDSFNLDGREGARKGLAASHLQTVMVESFDRNKPNFSTIAPMTDKAQAPAVLIIGTAPRLQQAFARSHPGRIGSNSSKKFMR